MAAQVRIGIAATGSRFPPETAERLTALAAAHYGGRVELIVHPHAHNSWGHFAGTDAERAAAFIKLANDPALDAVWIARGGYGANRLIEAVLPALGPAARDKTYLGYSDAGFLWCALESAGVGRLVHGPVCQDLVRDGGEAAALRALAWLVDRDPAALEPELYGQPSIALNLTILSHLVGTPWAPDLSGRVLIVEEVSEAMYRIDRSLFHVTSDPAMRRAAGIRLGRCTLIPPNDPDFGQDEETVCRHWCEQAGIPYLGRADIGHDAGNKLVPFTR